jgi:hypothetical protein
VPLYAVFTIERCRYDDHLEMTLAALCALMTGM